MSIKVRAALEVTGFILGTMIVVAGVKSILTALTDAYGIEAVLNSLAFGFMSVAAYVAVSLLYDIRVSKLQYRAKLEEMTKK